MLADRLTKAWNDRRKSTDIDVIMRFADDGLVLGAGTLLTPVDQARGRVSIDPEDPRLVALLTATHLGRPTALSLAHLCKAAERWREGDHGLCAMHLALSRIERLKHPKADAYRLFLADQLMKEGVEAAAIIKIVVSGGSDFERLRKEYNADQPRVPAGNGIVSGRWTTGDGSAAQAAPSESEVNPRTVTPAADHKSNSGAGRIAMLDCVRHVVQDSLGEHDNDNWREHWIWECQAAAKKYYDAEYTVEMNPKVTGGIVGFPDGGLIIMRKGKEDIYVPRGGRIRTLKLGIATG